MPSGTTVRPSEAPPAATFEMELTLPGPNGDVKIRVAVPLDKIKGYDPSKITTARVMPSPAQALTLGASTMNGAGGGNGGGGDGRGCGAGGNCGRGAGESASGGGGGTVPPINTISASTVSPPAPPLSTDDSPLGCNHSGDGATGATGTTGGTIAACAASATGGAGSGSTGVGCGRKVVRRDAYVRSVRARRVSSGRTVTSPLPVPVHAHRVLVATFKAPAPRYIAASVIETGEEQKIENPRSVAMRWLEAQYDMEDDEPDSSTDATTRRESMSELSPMAMQQLGLPPAAKSSPDKAARSSVGRRAIVQAWVDNSTPLHKITSAFVPSRDHSRAPRRVSSPSYPAEYTI